MDTPSHACAWLCCGMAYDVGSNGRRFDSRSRHYQVVILPRWAANRPGQLSLSPLRGR